MVSVATDDMLAVCTEQSEWVGYKGVVQKTEAGAEEKEETKNIILC